MDNSIAQVHTNCVSVFLTLIGVLNTSYHWNNQNEARDALDRYKLWAGNVGAMHSGTRYKSSLDYRLREASFYKDQVLRLMQDLHNCLNKALTAAQTENTAARDRITEHAELSDTDEDESDSSDSPWEVSSDSEVEDSSKQKLPQQNLGRPVPASQSPAKPALLDPIIFTIDCLCRLPIRSPAPIDRMKKKYITDTTAYLPFDIMYVKDKFPNLNETFTARLAKMISKRRQLMQYRKDHTDALQKKEVTVIDASKLEGGRLSILAGGDIASESAPSTRAPSQQTELTKATTLKIHAPMASFSPAFGLYTPSVSDFASSAASEQTASAIKIRLPNRPRAKEGWILNQFICPYCSTAQVITSERRWKKHVLSDLQPYICTYPDCHLHEYFFDSVDDWFHHESRTHRVEWYCNTESHQSFDEKNDFLDHMYTAHSESLDEVQLLSLHQGFQRPSNVHSGVCTLCGKHAKRLKSHLARHLEQLALFAIPQTDYMAALEDNDTSSNAARQSAPMASSSGSKKAPSELSSREVGSEASFTNSLSDKLYRSRAAKNAQTPEQYQKITVESSVSFEREVDTSWDQITPKFKDARTAMYSEQESEPSKRLPSTPSGSIDEGWMGERQKELLVPTEYTGREHRVAFDEGRPSGRLLVPRDTLEVISPSNRISRWPNSRESRRVDTLEIPTTDYMEPRTTTKALPSLRERAGRIASNLLSPFRTRKGSQARQDTPPVQEQQPLMSGAHQHPSVVDRSYTINGSVPDTVHERFNISFSDRGGGSFNPAGESLDLSQIRHDHEIPQRSTPRRTSRTSNILQAQEREKAAKNRGSTPTQSTKPEKQRPRRQRLSSAIRDRIESPKAETGEDSVPPQIQERAGSRVLTSDGLYQAEGYQSGIVAVSPNILQAQDEEQGADLQKRRFGLALEPRNAATEALPKGKRGLGV